MMQLFFIIVAVAIIFLIGGILCLVKYSKTKKKIFLILGIILTFVFLGIALYYVFRIFTAVTYGPASGMAYGPAPLH